MPHRVFCFTVTRASTPERAALLQATIVGARRTAAHEFDWHVWNSGCSMEGKLVLETALATGAIQDIHGDGTNVGQHVAWNKAYALAKAGGYDAFLRLDDDCEFISKRWLKKLLSASAKLEDKFILAPTVRGLINPPECSAPVEVEGINLAFLEDAIGGICRLHPLPLISDFIADVRKPLGSGDATGIASYCRKKIIPMAYLRAVRIRHAKTTRTQEESDPEHFSIHQALQHIPYIPPYTLEGS